MKTLKLSLVVALFVLPFSARASLCTPEYLERVNNRVAAHLFCALLPEDHVDECMDISRRVGLASLVVGALMGNRASSLANQAANPLRIEKINKVLPAEARRILGSKQDASFNSRALIAHLRKHPSLYQNNISLLQKSTRWATGARAVKTFTLIALLFSAVVTHPNECPALTWEGVEKEDNQWVAFGGISCAKYISPNFFELPLDEQHQITERSPQLCKLVSRASRDLETTPESAAVEGLNVAP